MTEIEEVTAANLKRLQDRKARGGYVDPLHVGFDQLVVTYNGQEVYVMNKRLLDQQNCWQNLEAIKETHWLKQMLYDMIRETDDKELLKSLAQDITECEFELQRLWKFSEDARFHRYWETPKCACPTMDNGERVGTDYTIINLGCVLHGD